jgi:hypothetical protein
LKLAVALLALVLLSSGSACALQVRIASMTGADLTNIRETGPASAPSCSLSYYYLLEGCAFVTVVGDIEENQAVGCTFDMSEADAWHSPCDTNACLTLDVIKIVLYDVLPPPSDQNMNVRVYPAGDLGVIEGEMLGNMDFIPAYTGEDAYSTSLVDFTNAGSVPGLDLSGCGGRFVVLLTWKNSTGHPDLVLDIISACLDSCASNAACCVMGTPPCTYPRTDIRTYDYGHGAEPGAPEPICDPGEGGPPCPTYGYLEALWETYFCATSASVEPTTWGTIKSLYR